MKKKKNTRKPLVTSVSSRIRSTVYDPASTSVSSPEETIARKKKFLGILDRSLEKIAENLEKGEMKLDSSLDLDRIIRLSLLVSGEAESITGRTGTETETEKGESQSIDRIEEILDTSDPAVKEVYDRLYSRYNELNDEEEQ